MKFDSEKWLQHKVKPKLRWIGSTIKFQQQDTDTAQWQLMDLVNGI